MALSLRKVVCAPDSFKESLPAAEVAAAMAQGVRRADPSIECDQCPVADGGEGSLEALVSALGGRFVATTVTGPLGQPVKARFGLAGHTGIVELAQASGISLVPRHQRDPTVTTTHGTGQLIAAALEQEVDTVIVCLGGSATVDGGTGIAQALGGRFYDGSGNPIEEPLTGGHLSQIADYEPPSGLPRLRVACDVSNPLCGPDGAAAVYGPQKGATPDQVEQLEAALRHLAELVKMDPTIPGAGAAGGAAYGLAAFCGAELERGVDLVLDAVRFRSRCAAADLVLTGEGSLDEQTLQGKACLGVAEAARDLGVPTVAIVGQSRLSDPDKLFASIISLGERFGLERSLAEPAALIAEVAAEIVR